MARGQGFVASSSGQQLPLHRIRARGFETPAWAHDRSAVLPEEAPASSRTEQVPMHQPAAAQNTLSSAGAHTGVRLPTLPKTKEEISKATGGLGIPGFKWPI